MLKLPKPEGHARHAAGALGRAGQPCWQPCKQPGPPCPKCPMRFWHGRMRPTRQHVLSNSEPLKDKTRPMNWCPASRRRIPAGGCSVHRFSRIPLWFLSGTPSPRVICRYVVASISRSFGPDASQLVSAGWHSSRPKLGFRSVRTWASRARLGNTRLSVLFAMQIGALQDHLSARAAWLRGSAEAASALDRTAEVRGVAGNCLAVLQACASAANRTAFTSMGEVLGGGGTMIGRGGSVTGGCLGSHS